MTVQAIDSEIAQNFDYFQRTLAEHLRSHAGKYALLKSGRLYGYFDTPADADREGWKRFSDHLYSIQQITPEPVELGLYANGAD